MELSGPFWSGSFFVEWSYSLARKKAAPKKQKLFELPLWDTAGKLHGSVELSEYKAQGSTV